MKNICQSCHQAETRDNSPHIKYCRQCSYKKELPCIFVDCMEETLKERDDVQFSCLIHHRRFQEYQKRNGTTNLWDWILSGGPL